MRQERALPARCRRLRGPAGAFLPRTLPVLMLLAAAAAPAAHAHGKKRHPGVADAHRQAMEAVKGRIPEELRALARPRVDPAPASLASGRALFAEHCAVCHGEGGQGDGPAAESLPIRPADFLDTAHSDVYGPGEKFWIITHGVPETGMPGFEGELSETQRWDLVNHILFLQGRTGRGERAEPRGKPGGID